MENIKRIKGYTINYQKKLGQGSYGKVYIGEQQTTKQKVAVKILDRQVIDNDEYLRNAIFTQIDILKSLKSPNIVEFKNVIESDHYYYIIQQLCDGGDLGKLIQNKSPLPQSQAIKYLIEIANGFVQLIKQGVIHRDLKPDNVFIHKGHLKIADFGFSKKLQNKRVKNQSMVGTPLYMSIQILKGIPYTSKCDIWALGLIFYQLLCKKTPWDANTQYELINNIQKKPLLIPNHISNVTRDFLTRCLKVQEKDRFSWDDLLRHQIFNGCFNSYFQKQAQLQNKLKVVMNKIKFETTKNNLNLEKIFKNLGFDKSHELKYNQFLLFMKTTGNNNLTQQQLRFFFQSIDQNDSNTISFGELMNALQKYNISTNANFDIINKILRLPSMQKNYTNFQNIDNLHKKINQSFNKLINYLQTNQIPLEKIFVSNKTHTDNLTLEEFGQFINRFGNFSQYEIQSICQKIDSSYKGMPGIIQFAQFYQYFCKIIGRPPRVYMQPKNNYNYVPISNYVNSPSYKKLQSKEQQYQSNQVQYNQSNQVQYNQYNQVNQVNQYNQQSGQLISNPPLSTSIKLPEGINVRFNQQLGIYTQVFDDNFHNPNNKKGLLGLISIFK